MKALPLFLFLASFILATLANGQVIFDAEDDTLFYIDPSGDVFQDGEQLCHVDGTGLFTDLAEDTLAWVSGNDFYWCNNQRMASIDLDGKVTTWAGIPYGSITGGGIIFNREGLEIADQGLVSRNYAIALTLIFFEIN